MNDPTPPMPPDFGLRYVLWFLWCNAITVLMSIQAVLSAMTLDPSLVPHDMFHYILIANAALTVLVAQTKRNNPPPPPPVKGQPLATIFTNGNNGSPK